MRTAAKVAIGLAAGLAAAYVAERVAVGRIRRRSGPVALPAGWQPHGDELWVDGQDGARIHAVAAGSGPTIVLSHGVMLSTAIWPLVFDPLVEQGFRVVAYDQRGHGRSTVGDSGFTAANLGHDLAAVLAAADAGRALVMGHSMGGLAVLALLAEHPEWRSTLAGAVLAGTTPATFRIPALLANAAATASRRFSGPALASHLHGTALTRVGFGPAAAGEAVELARGILAATDPVTIARANRALVGVDYRPLLAKLEVPVLVLAGKHDRVVPPQAVPWFAAGLPAARIVEIDAGHMLPLEAPERVVAETVAFARKLGMR